MVRASHRWTWICHWCGSVMKADSRESLTSLVTRGTPKCQKWSFSSPLYTTFPKRAMFPVLHSPFPGLVSANAQKKSRWLTDISANMYSLWWLLLCVGTKHFQQVEKHTVHIQYSHYMDTRKVWRLFPLCYHNGESS